MGNIHNIYNDIADTINPNSNLDTLGQNLSNTDYDWELLVKVGSGQLILPTIYCHLKRKDLLKFLPEDLQEYLEEITRINRNRNKTILEEVESISSLFSTHEVEHVFLKGTALLVSGYYKDLGERMIGDIDILVNANQLHDAQKLLLNHGYDEVETTFGFDFFEHKHLARLIPKTKLAAVEVHRKLLLKSVKNTLQTEQILDNKQFVSGIPICSDEDLLIHTVLNFQVNDYGYYYNYLGLRNAYDTLIVSERISEPDLNVLISHKYIRSFFDKMNVYFKIDSYHKKSILRSINNQFFVLKQNNMPLSKTSYFILNFVKILGLIFHRLFVFIVNPAYRKESLKDYKRILGLFKTRLNPFLILVILTFEH